MNKREEIRNILTKISDEELVSIWNEYCYNTNHFDDEILDYERMEETIENSTEGGLYWVNRFFYGRDWYGENESANPNRNYFTFNGYGNIISFDYLYNAYKDEFYNIDECDLIDYIIENREDFNNSEIREILEADETTEEE